MRHLSWIQPAAVACLLALASAPSAAADDSIGMVVGLRGTVSAAAPGQTPRVLSCGDLVGPGEVLTTERASRVSVLIGDVYAQLFVQSAARFELSEAGGADLMLSRGRMRVVDPRSRPDAPPVHVATPNAEARFAANDVDSYVLGPAGDTNAMICAERVSLDVDRLGPGSESSRAAQGRCAIASRGKAMYLARIPSERIGLTEADACEPDRGPVAADFQQTDVAAGPVGGLQLPGAGEGPPRHPCDVPESACGLQVTVQDTTGGFGSDPLGGGEF
jgi:hypothetical protein